VPATVFQSSNLSGASGGAITVTGGEGDVALNGETGNIYFHIIALDGQVQTSLAEIGVGSIIQRGVIQAVDLFGLLPNGVSATQFLQPVTVCLRGSGSVFLLSANDRVPVLLPSDTGAGYTCASVPNAGTVVLVQ
jgi:hypothetical protein